MRCDASSHWESTLRCGKCGEIVCPRCMVETPVGARCRECAGLYKLPTFNVTPKHYLIASIVGLGIAFVFAFLWRVTVQLFYFPYLNFLVILAVGWVIGEVVSLSVNRKRGIFLAVIASLSVVVCYLIARLRFWGFAFSIFDLPALIIGIFIATNRLR